MDPGPIRSYLDETAPILFFGLDPDGRIQTLNRYAKGVCGEACLGMGFEALIVDFGGAFDLAGLAAAPSGSRLLNVNTANGFPQSYLFTFRATEGGILVFGHLDLADVERMRTEIMQLNQEFGNLNRRLHKTNAQLQYALDHVKTLQGIIPICMYCHKIRGEQEIWDKLEAYLAEHAGADLSHTICPDCMQERYPEIDGEEDE